MKRGKFISVSVCFFAVISTACEKLDDDISKHVSNNDSLYIELEEVAQILTSIPFQVSHMEEVHQAVCASSTNGYDEEYMMQDLFAQPGKGVGDPQTRTDHIIDNAMRDLIEEYVRESMQTKSGSRGVVDPEKYIEVLTSSDIQIYWPYSENWDGRKMPIITFDPEDGADVNIGYRLCLESDGTRRLEKLLVDEEMAMREPVWVVNRNSDAGFTTLQMLRKEDPDWGQGGGDIIIEPKTRTNSEGTHKCLRLKTFTMRRNYDMWLAGGSEFMIKVGSVDDFTASTGAELRLFNPKVTDLMLVVKRSQVGVTLDIGAILISDWNPQMTHCALLIHEDDGGIWENWKCTALVRIASKSYGIELSLPIHSFDDIVWRGQLSSRWLEANSDVSTRFGDVNIKFELVEY